MKVPHKLKSVKELIRSIEGALEKLLLEGRKTGRKRREVVPLVHELERLVNEFDDRFRNSSYNVALEVQIFDLPSYVRAEKDLRSSASHYEYKRSQVVREIVPILWPVEIYGEEAFRKLLIPEIETHGKNP